MQERLMSKCIDDLEMLQHLVLEQRKDYCASDPN